jgi:hypothetical protein
VRTCSQCGTTLADQTQYCMQCGTPVAAGSTLSSNSVSGNFFKPALIAGAVMGILSSIPILNLGCCMWIIGGGGLGTWRLGKNQPGGPGALTYGDGAFVGALSGLFGGVLGTIVGLPFRPSAADIEELFLEIAPDIDSGMLETLLRFVELSPLSVVTALLFNVFFYSLFAMVGGILMVAILGHKAGKGAGPRPPQDS